MGAVIVGKPSSGQKVLRKSTLTTEVDGLTLLSETYTIRTADISTIEPDRNTLHSAFVNQDQTPKYTRMSVETTRVEPMDGDLASLTVNYVGLTTTSGLPPAFVTAVGQAGVGIFGADAVIVAKYITSDSLFDLLKGGILSIGAGASRLLLPTKRLMPATINGTSMPPNPRPREYRRTKNQSEAVAAAEQYYYDNYVKKGIGNRFVLSRVIAPPLIEWVYAGYVQSSISFERRGLFNQIEEQFTEYFRGTDDFYTGDGIPNLPKINSFSDVNSLF